jgi:hypothetical protein
LNFIDVLVMLLLSTVLWQATVDSRPPADTRNLHSLSALNHVLQVASAYATEHPDGDGATVIVSSQTGQSTYVVVAANRPDGSAQGETLATVQLDAPVTAQGTTSYGIVVDPNGRANVLAPWSAWTPVATEPADCSTVSIVVGSGTSAKTGTLSCVNAVIDAP